MDRHSAMQVELIVGFELTRPLVVDQVLDAN